MTSLRGKRVNMPFKKMREILAHLEIEPVWSELFEFLADQVDHIVWLADVDSNLIFINDYWVEITGISKEKAVLENQWKNCIPHIDLELLLELAELSTITEEPLSIAYKIVDPNTDITRKLTGKVYPFKDNLGKVRFWVGISKEVDNV